MLNEEKKPRWEIERERENDTVKHDNVLQIVLMDRAH